MRHHDSKRELLLQTAAEIVIHSGVSAMTLEAVAKKANVSKGGLLYHFPSKDALIEAMSQRLEQEFETAIEAEIKREEEDGNAPLVGRWLRAYVRVSTTPESEIDALSGALLAALNENPTLLNSMKKADRRWQQLAENDGIDVALATLIRLSCDGCWLSGLFGFDAGFESKSQLMALQNSLLQLIEHGIAKQEK